MKKILFALMLLAPVGAHASGRWLMYTSTPNINCSSFIAGGALSTNGTDIYCVDTFNYAAATSAFSAVSPLQYSNTVFSLDKSSVTLQGNTFNSAGKLMQLNSAGSVTVPNTITASTAVVTSTVALGNNGSNNAMIDSLIFPTDSGWVRYAAIQGFRGSDSAHINLDFYTMVGDSEGIQKRFRIADDGSLIQYKTGVTNQITAGTVFSGYETHAASQTFTTAPISMTPYSAGVMHIVAGSSNVATGLVYLSTETSGNYVGALNTAAPLTGGNVGQQNAQLTIGIDASSATLQGNTFNAANKLLQLNGSALVPNAQLDSSSVTLQGNSFNAANKLLQLSSSGLVPNAQVDGSSVTKMGNTFNGASQLVQLNGSTQLPAISGVNLTNLNASNLASGTVPNAQIDGSSVTKQGNTFNGASQLVQMNSSTQLPAVSGVNLTNLNGSNVASGTVGSARLPTDTVYNDVNTTFTSSNTYTGISTFTANVVINNDIYTTALTDYSGTSSITGWTSFTTKVIQYKKIGKTVQVWFDLRGTSNSTSTSFTIPTNTNSNLGLVLVAVGWLDNGTGGADMGECSVGTGSNTVNCYKDNAGTAWTASGTKFLYGTLIYEAP